MTSIIQCSKRVISIGKGAILSLITLCLFGCSNLSNVFNSKQAEQDITALLITLNSCQYTKEERKRMYDAAYMGNKNPYPLLYCEGERNSNFDVIYMKSLERTDFKILGYHFEDDGYGAALVQVRIPAWRLHCEELRMWDAETCAHLVMGINAPHLKKVDNKQREELLVKQNILPLTGDPPTMVDYYLMPLKRNIDNELTPNWVENDGAIRANLELADKLGEVVGPIKVYPYDLVYDLLRQDDLPSQYMGVFYYASPQLLDFAPRPAPEYSIPLRRGVPGRGHRASIYRAIIGTRVFE